MSKRQMKRPPGACDSKIKSDFTSWKKAVETKFNNYCAEPSWQEDKISWLEEILNDNALPWNQARAGELQKLRVRDN
jgi:hypothetical protein